MIPALPTSGPWVPVFLLLAVLMVGGNVYILSALFPRGNQRPTLATAILLLGILLMSMALWFSGIYAVISPGQASTVSVFIAVNSMMAVVGLWAVSLLFRAGTKFLPTHGLLWPLGFAMLIVGNELLMGLTFVLAQVGPSVYAAQGGLGLAALVGDAAVSAWFLWAMLATMVFVISWLPLSARERWLVYGFAGSAAVGPWVVPDPVIGAVAMAGVMTVTFLLLAREIRRVPKPAARYLWVGLGVSIGFLAMGAGEALAYLLGRSAGASFPFGLASFLVMTGELFVIVRWGLRGPTVDLPPEAPSPGRTEGPAGSTPAP